ncbi:MAG: thiamine pyrophosphate-dependent dehydrogenase E1 component subunit alpha [Alphaproteobacteria bacterium]|nr:thiamine pyrophosphate-dependent dehydrogenase E1 component subunit alpha [Alphaproteobacteria bacterium]
MLARLIAHQRTMARIRAFEEAAAEAAAAGEVLGLVHPSIGQEAVAAGVCANLERHDLVTSTHRGHGHTLAKGADLAATMAELFGKASGFCKGKGGSMHIADFSVGMLGANGVVAAGIPIAVGAAQALKLRRLPGVAVTFFGDGATNRGPFFESLNWAALFRLPVLFVCEDNGFGSTTRNEAVSAGPGPAARAEACGVPARTVDGSDVAAVDEAAAALLAEIRASGSPRLLHARTHRFLGHTSIDAQGYRSADELAACRKSDPIAFNAARLRALGCADAEISAIAAAAGGEVAAAVAAARAAPHAPSHEAFADIQDIGGGLWR